MLAVVIPTLDAAADLPACLDGVAPALSRGLVDDVMVVDGGSVDATCEISRRRCVRVVTAARGRGLQLRAGAGATLSPWLLFLHADTVLEPGWHDPVQAFIADPANAARAAVFRFALDDGSGSARRLAAMVNWRTRVLALPYGDQGLLISRAFYDALGGHAPIPLMEDVDIIWRIGRHRLVCLDAVATTSARRYRQDGWWRRSARNLLCLSLYSAGVAPRHIEKIYR
jgi:rSAM/selenodomain-associated transferase 2